MFQVTDRCKKKQKRCSRGGEERVLGPQSHSHSPGNGFKCFEAVGEWFLRNQISVVGVCLSEFHLGFILPLRKLLAAAKRRQRPCPELLGYSRHKKAW